MSRCFLVVFMFLPALAAAQPAQAQQPIPDRLVVLTFDDSVKSHFTFVRPLLKKYGFGATFFVTEGFDFATDKQNYMTWEEIARLHSDGFEVGNHTRDHMTVSAQSLDRLAEQLAAISRRCEEHGIPRPVSFAYPGNGTDPGAFAILRAAGIRFARRGGAPERDYESGRGYAYEPGLDHPLLIPSAGDARPRWTLDDFKRAADQARFGRIAVLQFHGVPDLAHPWVNSPIERFQEYMKYLADNDFTVIAMRDLARYVDSEVAPRDSHGAINDRLRAQQQKLSRDDLRAPAGDVELRRWLTNMVGWHRYSIPEVRAATGLTSDVIEAALRRWKIRQGEVAAPPDQLVVMPYPGGRHPRIGFLDGAIRPQRETKVSVFLPWDRRQYVVLDIPEAIRRNDEPEHGLLYLAHTHVDTMWTKQRIPLQPLEWTREKQGQLVCERRLPNGVVFGTRVDSGKEAVRMTMWLKNGSSESLSNLRVQNCVMLKGAPSFIDGPREVIREPYVALEAQTGSRWMIIAWDPCHRAWQNPPCPCVHSDPQFPDCAPGQTQTVNGWLSFYEGDDIEKELDRIDATGWRQPLRADD